MTPEREAARLLPDGVEELALVAAVARGGAIGRRGGLPWHLPEDLRHFRRVTEGHVVLVGRRTWESLGRPLPGRTLLVLSRDPRLALPRGAQRTGSLAEALRLAAVLGDRAPRVAGGAVLYRAALPLATELWLTEVDLDVPDADTFFPSFDPAAFELVEERRGEDPRLTFRRFARCGGPR